MIEPPQQGVRCLAQGLAHNGLDHLHNLSLNVQGGRRPRPPILSSWGSCGRVLLEGMWGVVAPLREGLAGRGKMGIPVILRGPHNFRFAVNRHESPTSPNLQAVCFTLQKPYKKTLHPS